MTLSVFANLPHKTRVVVKGRGGMVMVNGILEGSDKQHNIQLQDTLPSGNYILKLENSRWRVSQGFEITPIDTTLLRG